MSGVRDPGQQKGIPHNDWIASQKGAARNDGTLNFPLFLTSANLSGHPESKTLLEAKEFFPSVE